VLVAVGVAGVALARVGFWTEDEKPLGPVQTMAEDKADPRAALEWAA
jgi:hypothetical protein